MSPAGSVGLDFIHRVQSSLPEDLYFLTGDLVTYCVAINMSDVGRGFGKTVAANKN